MDRAAGANEVHVASFSDRMSGLPDRVEAEAGRPAAPPPPGDGPELPPTGTTATAASELLHIAPFDTPKIDAGGLELPPLDDTATIASELPHRAPFDTPKVDTGGPQAPATGTVATTVNDGFHVYGEYWPEDRGAPFYDKVVDHQPMSGDLVVGSGRGAIVPWSDLGP